MPEQSRKYAAVIVMVMLVFFLISFATNILNAIITEVKIDYGLSLTATGFLPFAFFIAYGVMSVPAGYLAEKWSSKSIIIAALTGIAAASSFFAFFPDYGVFLVTLFALGCCMAILQVVINPLLRVAGGGEHFAFYSLLAQLVFGGASFLSPLVYQQVVAPDSGGVWGFLRALTFSSLNWTAMYMLFAALAVLLAVLVWRIRFPEVVYDAEERPGTLSSFSWLLKQRVTYFYFFGIFAYVGIEQGIGNWISPFLNTYHQVDPQTLGALTVSRFWGMLTLGCVLGLLLVKIADSRWVLSGFTLMSMISLIVAVTGSEQMALMAFPAIGFFISVMWSVIFSLALNSVQKAHGSFSGILCTGIAGGAFVPLLVGMAGEIYTLKTGMFFLLIPLLYVLIVGLRARPVVRNKTIF